jgi:hypothetical protein
VQCDHFQGRWIPFLKFQGIGPQNLFRCDFDFWHVCVWSNAWTLMKTHWEHRCLYKSLPLKQEVDRIGMKMNMKKTKLLYIGRHEDN